MKKISLLMLLLVAPGLFAQVIDKTVATVKLSKTEVISAKKFQQKVQTLEAQTRAPLSAEDRRKLLDVMVKEILIVQAAGMDNVTVSQAELDKGVERARVAYSVQLKAPRALTEAEFRSLMERSNVSWDEFIAEMRKTLLIQKYVTQKKKAFLDGLVPPTDAEIEDAYLSNSSFFAMPDIVRFKHIFIDTRSLPTKEEREKARARADEILRQIRNGVPFDDLLERSDDELSRYKGGDAGYLRRDDQARREQLGREFFDAIFKLEVNQLSGVLPSNVGYHIIQVTEKQARRVLDLDDRMSADGARTVRDYVRAELLSKKQEDYFKRALEDLAAELRKKASIQIFEENIAS